MLGDLRFAPCAVGGRPGWGSAYGTAATAISTNVRSYRRGSLPAITARWRYRDDAPCSVSGCSALAGERSKS